MAETFVEPFSNILLDNDIVLKICEHIILNAARITVNTANHSAVIGFDAITFLNPSTDGFFLVENRFELFFDKGCHKLSSRRQIIFNFHRR